MHTLRIRHIEAFHWTMSKFGDLQTTIVTLLVGSLLIGLSFAALLPPFEGFDETAHYSSIEQIAETGKWPRLNDPIAAEVSDYLRCHTRPDIIARPVVLSRFLCCTTRDDRSRARCRAHAA
jgi:hypothetical protein